MEKLIYFLLLLFTLSSCDNLTSVEVRNDEGRLIEQYHLDADSIRQGDYVSFHDNGRIFEKSYYKDGSFEGERTFYYNNDSVEIKEFYENGVLNGPYQTFYKNGQLNLDATFVDGAMEGLVKRYYESGELLEEVTFKDNLENGPFKEYFKNGQVKWEGNYKDGDNEFGIILSYNEDGTLIRKMECGKYKGEYICQTVWTLEDGARELTLTYDKE